MIFLSFFFFFFQVSIDKDWVLQWFTLGKLTVFLVFIEPSWVDVLAVMQCVRQWDLIGTCWCQIAYAVSCYSTALGLLVIVFVRAPQWL